MTPFDPHAAGNGSKSVYVTPVEALTRSPAWELAPSQVPLTLGVNRHTHVPCAKQQLRSACAAAAAGTSLGGCGSLTTAGIGEHTRLGPGSTGASRKRLHASGQAEQHPAHTHLWPVAPPLLQRMAAHGSTYTRASLAPLSDTGGRRRDLYTHGAIHTHTAIARLSI